MMDIKEVQKRYPEFIYRSSAWEFVGGDIIADFWFVCNDIEFRPRTVIRGVSVSDLEQFGEDSLSNLVFNLGLAEIPTYWKAFCSPKIVIDAGYLEKTQKNFWQDLFFNGMGQFFFENKLPFIKPDIVISASRNLKFKPASRKLADRYLVPLGGGKDSLVTLEFLRADGKQTCTFTYNANNYLKNVVAVSGARNFFVERTIDPKLLELNRAGHFNGHTPFSSLLYILGSLLAGLFDFKYVALSQERSSNEGNVKYRRRNVNHQYSKTFALENRFRKYSQQYLVKNAQHFSLLRPLYELQIARIFADYPKYFPHFLSCNRSFTIRARQEGNTAKWCGACPKCLFMFAALYAAIGREQTVKIFAKDLFTDGALASLMADLVGAGSCKPFECVGTFKEAQAAFYLCLCRSEAEGGVLPLLLEIFKNKYLKNRRSFEKDSAKILSSWDTKNNLPKPLARSLKARLARG